jgi:hypothetical protein
MQDLFKQSPACFKMYSSVFITVGHWFLYSFFIHFTFYPGTGHEGTEGEYRYTSTLSLTLALDGVGGQRHALAALLPGKIRYSLYRRLGGPQGRPGRFQKIRPTPGFDLRNVQPAASRYTD